MPFLRAIIGPLSSAYKAEKEIEGLEGLIHNAEDEYSVPLLDRLSDAERFDAALRLYDATLEFRIRDSALCDRSEMIASYIDALHKEYRMAKESLQSQAVSKAEVAALTIAIRHLSAEVSREFAAIEERHRQEIAETRAHIDATGSRLQRWMAFRIRMLESQLDTAKRQRRWLLALTGLLSLITLGLSLTVI